MTEFRNILADGDLIRQQQLSRWWLFGDKNWSPYRNLSREVRNLEERMHTAHAAYKAAQDIFVVSQKNVTDDINMLRAYKMGNSEVSYEIPSDESIIVRRDGIKYGSSSNSSGKQNNQRKGNGNNQQHQQKSGEQQQHGKKPDNNRQPRTLMDLLMNTRVVH